MPIDYSKYPDNWKTEIRPRILNRAKNKCECCGLPNGMRVFSFKKDGETFWNEVIYKDGFDEKTGFKMVKVVLTIAHLDHDEDNHQVADDRLKAMCQLCHLRYDAKEKVKRKSNQIQ